MTPSWVLIVDCDAIYSEGGHMKKCDAIRFLVAVVCLIFFPGIATAADYKYPIDDLSVAIKFPPVKNLTRPIIGKHFEGGWSTGGLICASLYFAVQNEFLQIQGSTLLNLLDGTASTELAVYAGLEAREDYCRLGVFKGMCSATASIVGSTDNKLTVGLPCLVHWTGTPFGYWLKQKIEVPLPVITPASVSIQLPPTNPRPGDFDVDATFAHLQQGIWASLPAPNDKKLDYPVGGGVYFHSQIYPGPTDPTKVHMGGDQLVTVSAFRRKIEVTQNINDAIANSIFSTPRLFNDPYAFAAIRIRPELFVPSTYPPVGTRGSGLIGSLFPLLISARQRFNEGAASRTLIANLVLGAAQGAVTIAGGQPDFQISLRTDHFELKIEETGETLSTSQLRPTIQILGPTVETDGRLTFSYVSSGLDFPVDVRGQQISIRLSDFLNSQLNSKLPGIAKITKEVVSSTPDCIEVGEEKMIPYRPCSSFAPQNSKLMALNLNDGASTEQFAIDLTKTQIWMEPREFLIVFYYDVDFARRLRMSK